jgi:CRP-like cAMP-binding protein/predicted MFS family arabinose efflux permease
MKLPDLFTSLRHRDFRLLMEATAISVACSWAYNVALTVWIFNETGSAAWVGAATIGRFVPALLFSAYAGVIAERFERVRLMVVLDLASTVVMLVLALETAVHAPVALAILTAAITSTMGTVYEPAATALTPQVVGERDLGSANALRNTLENVLIIAGPAIGALLLIAGPPSVCILLNAVSFFVSAIIVSRIHARSAPVDVTEGGEAGPFRQMLVGLKAIVTSETAAVLVAYSVVASFVFGVDTVQFVILSRDVLGTGAEGYGYLLMGLGVGGVLMAGFIPRIERLPRLGPVILLGIAFYCAPTLLFLVVSSPVVAFAIEVVRGAGTLVVDVLAMTALQRALPSDQMGRVFGAFGGLVLLAIVIGAYVTPIGIDVFGLDATLWLAGAAIPVLCLLGVPALRVMDRQAAARLAELAPRIELLERCDLFASISPGALEQLAGAADYIEVALGEFVVREGEEADAFYVVASGRLTVTSRGEAGREQYLGELGAGEYFGEIGLIERIPRTATVKTLEPNRLLRVSGQDFLDALTEAAPSVALMEGASARLRRTHPSLSVSQAAGSDGS